MSQALRSCSSFVQQFGIEGRKLGKVDNNEGPAVDFKMYQALPPIPHFNDLRLN
jgi:hypothetical protein